VSGAALLDARGCLTPAGLAALAASPPGRGPAEAAAHLARCARCQERALEQAAGRDGQTPRVRKAPPPLWRTGAVIVALLGMIAMIVWTLSRAR
jgi:hypothetical protein